MATDTPRIYVADLAAYNNGKLHGAWIDATQDPEEIQEEVTAMLAKSPEPFAEEWAIHDYDGFGSINLGEWESFEKVSEIAQGIEEHGEAFTAFLSMGREAEEFEEAYAGTWDDEKDFAYDYVDEVGWGGCEKVPEGLESYLNWDMIARDLFMEGYSSAKTSDYRVFVFRDL